MSGPRMSARGLQERAANIGALRRVIAARLQDAEKRHAEAEADLAQLRALDGFARSLGEETAAALQALQDAEAVS